MLFDLSLVCVEPTPMTNDEVPLIEPVRYIPEDAGKQPEPGIALCLSGGGYRAMLFHTGTLWRLYEANKLHKIDRISSVSGGSITAGVLAMNWEKLFAAPMGQESFEEYIAGPIRILASRTIDVRAVILGSIWFGSIGNRVAVEYKRIFGETTLQDIPNYPRFVINSTNIQSGALWRFSKPYMRDYRVGEIKSPKISLAVAVAASSAFPPVLSPVTLKFDECEYTPGSIGDLKETEFRTKVFLTDGGVYDNMGLETSWKNYETILVSDAGAAFSTQSKPKWDWIRHAFRTLMLIDNQVRNLRRRQLVESYVAKIREGSFWSINHNIETDFGTVGSLPCPADMTSDLAETPTRLKKLSARKQEQLINWGYAICDAAIRKWVWKDLTPPVRFPYPAAGVGNERRR